MELNLEKEIEALTRSLVSINSIDGKEKQIADYIEKYLYDIDYFKKHPKNIINFKCEENRNSLLAYLKGKGQKTIILMGHIDTVDIKDYGKCINDAFNPDKLAKSLKKNFDLPNQVIKDIDSNKYMFARGALDMKAGVASMISVFKYFANNLNELNGNLVLLLECDEEGNSLGVIKGLDELIKLKKKEKLEYVACLNGDYSTSDDNKRYVYLGTVGKLLPGFVCIGKEAHVGDPYAGFDPNLLLSIVNKNISLNPDFADKADGKTSVPPICLKQSDDKDLYTVQTALSAMSYFNYMLYKSSPNQVMNKCLSLGKTSFDETINLLNQRYKTYCLNNNKKYTKLAFKTRVYCYSDWMKLLSKNPNFNKEISDYGKKLLKANPNIDNREYAYKLICKSYEYYELKQPVLIVFFGSSFYSSIETKDKKIVNAVNDAITSVSKESKYDIETSYYYPYISDMSFMSTKLSEKEVDELTSNYPFKLNYPYQKIKEIDVPVVNVGTYGKDGHTYIERLEKRWSFVEAPNITYLTIKNYLK